MRKAKFIRSIGCFFLALFIVGCVQERQIAGKDLEQTLTSVYQRMGYTKLGKDYPNQEMLQIWKQNNAYSKTYEHVQNAKNDLRAQIAVAPQQTLTFTLDTMFRECDHKSPPIEAQLKCTGAITALFFFNQNEQDKIIMDRFLGASPEVMHWVAGNHYEWFHNRPNPQRWIDALENIPSDQLEPNLKQTMILCIKDATHDSEKFGVMLE